MTIAFAETARKIDDRELPRWKGVVAIALSPAFCVLFLSSLEPGHRTIPLGLAAASLLLSGTFAVIRPRVPARRASNARSS